LTSLTTSSETGARFEYHGHSVAFEWQSRQAAKTSAREPAGKRACLVVRGAEWSWRRG
jgi:hypothetical protein